MFKKLFSTFSLLNSQTKSTIYIRRINKTRTIIVTIFANVYIYQIHGAVSELIISNMLYFIGSAIGYWIGGLCIHYKGETNIKNLFYPAFIVLSLSFITMPLIGHLLRGVMTFFFIVGVGSGLFYFGTTNYEGLFLTDELRNFYSSTLNAGYIVLKITTPLLVALFFFLEPHTSINGYTLLFISVGIIYLFGLWFIHTIPDHKVKRQSLSGFKKYFQKGSLTAASAGFFATYGLDKGVQILFSLLLIIVLKSEISIGIYEGVLNFIAIFVMIALGVKATKKQQDSIFLIAATGFALLCFIVGWVPSLYSLIAFSIGMIIIEPILRSMRLADFYRYQDVINRDGSLSLGVLYSETLMTIGRCFLFLIVLILSYYVEIELIIAWGMSLFSLCYFFIYWNVKTLLPKFQK